MKGKTSLDFCYLLALFLLAGIAVLSFVYFFNSGPFDRVDRFLIANEFQEILLIAEEGEIIFTKGYKKNVRGEKLHPKAIDMFFPYAAASLATTVEDLYRFDLENTDINALLLEITYNLRQSWRCAP